MFSVSQLGVDFTAVLLNVLAIIGIIVAGGFLIFFLGDLLLSVLDPQNSALKMSKDKDISKVADNQYSRLAEPEKPQELTYGQNNYKTVDYNKALEEEKLLKSDKVEPIIFAPQPEPEQVKPIVEEKQQSYQPEDIFAELRAEEELFKQEKLKAATEHRNVFESVKKEPVKEEDDFDFDDIFFSDDEDEEVVDENEEITEVEQEQEENEQPEELNFNFEEVAQEDEEERQETEEVEEVEEKPAVNEVLAENEELKGLQNENAILKQQLEQLLLAKQAEQERVTELLNKKEKTVTVNSGSLEEYEEKLEILRERLKYNEKELRSIKREFIPLRKVRKTLENDKKKLRRREALVAKQKILLYGVNNIIDIDQDKAKKLEDDLDLLDGLRLSVGHCEEVIKNSAERYPVLETSYNILTKNISQIRSDIEDIEKQIAKLK